MLEFLFRRKKKSSIDYSFTVEDIICEKDIKDFISKWMAEEDWGFLAFPYFLKSARGGVLKTPITLTELENGKFTCVTADNQQFDVTLVFGNFYDCAMFYITEGNVVSSYDIIRCRENGKNQPKANLTKRTVTVGEKELNCFFSKYFSHRCLKLSENLVLRLDMDGVIKNGSNFNNADTLSKSRRVDDYLLNLDCSEEISTKKVWENVIKLLELSSSELKALSQVIVVLEEKGEEEIEKSKYVLVDSKCKEYAETIDGATYHVYADGNWKYYDGTSKLVWMENGESLFKYSFTTSVIKKPNGDVESIKPEEIVAKSQDQIAEMQKIFN